MDMLLSDLVLVWGNVAPVPAPRSAAHLELCVRIELPAAMSARTVQVAQALGGELQVEDGAYLRKTLRVEAARALWLRFPAPAHQLLFAKFARRPGAQREWQKLALDAPWVGELWTKFLRAPTRETAGALAVWTRMVMS